MMVGRDDIRVMLASRSPRRRLLLDEHGIPHDAHPPHVDDGGLRSGGVAPSHWVTALAWFKAAAGAHSNPEFRGTILGADTVCVLDDRIIGQPTDETHAREIIRSFENRPHDVITGVALFDVERGRRTFFSDGARVTVGSIGEDRIDEYLSTGAWRGKAGAYNLRDRIEAGWPIEYDGDPTTVMGLPMRKLVEQLQAFEESWA